MKHSFKAISLVILAAGLSACIVSPRHGHYHDGPPHHAPAHGYYSYWYYPEAEVYFDIHRELYFYIDAGRWITVKVLPPHLHHRLGSRVDLRMQHDKPYREHRHHKRRYPAHKYRNRHDRYEKDKYRDHRRRHDDDSHPDRRGYKDDKKKNKMHKRKYRDDRRDGGKEHRKGKRRKYEDDRDEDRQNGRKG